LAVQKENFDFLERLNPIICFEMNGSGHFFWMEMAI